MSNKLKVPWIGLLLVLFIYVVVSVVVYHEPLGEVLVETAIAAVLGVSLVAAIGYARSRRS